MPNQTDLDALAADIEALRTYQRTVLAQLESDAQDLARRVSLYRSGGSGRDAEVQQLTAELSNLRGAVADNTRVAEQLRAAIRAVLAEYDKLPCRGAEAQAISAAREMIR